MENTNKTITLLRNHHLTFLLLLLSISIGLASTKGLSLYVLAPFAILTVGFLIINKIEFGFYLAIFLLPIEAIQGKYLNEIHAGKTVFLLFIAALWLMRNLLSSGNGRRKTLTQNNSLIISAIFFLLVTTVFSAFSSIENIFIPSIRAVFRLGVYIVTFCLIMPRIFDNREKLIKVVKFIFVVTLFHSIFAFYQLIGSYILKTPTLLRDVYDTNISLGLTRPHGIMSEPMPFANFFFLPAFLALSLSLRKNEYFTKRKIFFLAFIFLLSCILTFSRGGWLSLFIGMAIFLYINRNYFSKIVIMVGKVAFVLILIFYLSISFYPPLNEKLNNFIRFSGEHRAPAYAYRDAVGDRLKIIHNALKIFSDNPFGVGIRNYGFVLGKLTGAPGRITTTLNSYLDILVELGFLGLFAFIGIALLLLRKARYLFRKTDDALNKSLIIGVTCAFIASLVQLNFFYYWQEYDFWFLIGMFLTTLNIVARNSQYVSL